MSMLQGILSDGVPDAVFVYLVMALLVCFCRRGRPCAQARLNLGGSPLQADLRAPWTMV